MSTMKLCPSCNTELKASSSFCTECGYRFESVDGIHEHVSPTKEFSATQQQTTPQPVNVSGPLYPGACNNCKLLFPAGTFACVRCNGPLKAIVDVPPSVANKLPPTGLDLTSLAQASSSRSGRGIGYWIMRIVIFLILSAVISFIGMFFG